METVMDFGWIATVSGFALVMAGTPGPNNTLLTASGANYGFRRTLPHLVGVALGVAVIFLAVGAVGSAVVSDPRLSESLKWVGLAYMLWLAWKIGSARPTTAAASADQRSASKPLTLMQGALFQLVNPKLWAMVAGAVTAYGSAAADENPLRIAVAFALIFGIATFAGTAVWALMGVQVGRLIRRERAVRLFNWTMAAALVASVIPVLAP
jgi:threonine/homoserine/homoserine lactone efflux protein